MTLLDSNILLRQVSPRHEHNPATVAALEAMDAAGEECVIFPQNIYEFWASATRPVAANGLGMTVAECRAEVAELLQFFSPFSPTGPASSTNGSGSSSPTTAAAAWPTTPASSPA